MFFYAHNYFTPCEHPLLRPINDGPTQAQAGRRRPGPGPVAGSVTRNFRLTHKYRDRDSLVVFRDYRDPPSQADPAGSPPRPAGEVLVSHESSRRDRPSHVSPGPAVTGGGTQPHSGWRPRPRRRRRPGPGPRVRARRHGLGVGRRRG